MSGKSLAFSTIYDKSCFSHHFGVNPCSVNIDSWKCHEKKVKMDSSLLISFMFVAVLVDQTSTEQYIVSLARKSRVRQTSNGHFYHNEIQPTPQPYIMEKGYVHLMPY